MSQGLHQVQKQTQQLVLAPQLRQSLKILQVPAMELRNTILEELQSNPLLEELPGDSALSIDNPTGENGTTPNAEEASTGVDKEMDFGDDYRILNELNEDWKEFYSQESSNNVFTSDDAERRQHFFDSLVSETSLQEHLLSQAKLTELDEEEMTAIQYLVGSLDDRGFLTTTPSDIALMANLPLKKVQVALESLKTLDPPGIGSADLRECLLVQLRIKRQSQSLAAHIIREHFDLLLRRRIPEISRKVGTTPEDVHEALEVISGLDPAPARRFSEDQNRVVDPDVKVEEGEGEWIITLNNDYIPRLRLSSAYKELIAKGQLNPKEKEYVQDKLRSGKFLISSIEQRQQTLERITREILKFQEDFFHNGISGLKPLTMNQVAQEVGVHETTVSRAIANKYMDTPHGVFDFKFFFTPGYQSGDGRTMSNTSVKDTIANLIENENPEKPLSDQEIVNILAEKQLKIARRTVAKYREEMGILPTNLRRRYR